jgi:hypothetical protein
MGNDANLIATQACLFKTFNTHSMGTSELIAALQPNVGFLSTPNLWEPFVCAVVLKLSAFNTHSMGTRTLLSGFPLLWPLLPHLFFRLGISMG